MAIAQIALDSGIITQDNVAKAEALIAALAPEYPKTGPSLMESACWADDIRSSRPETSAWHFIDIPDCHISGGNCPQPPAENVVWAIGQDKSNLTDPNADDLTKEEVRPAELNDALSFFARPPSENPSHRLLGG